MRTNLGRRALILVLGGIGACVFVFFVLAFLFQGEAGLFLGVVAGALVLGVASLVSLGLAIAALWRGDRGSAAGGALIVSSMCLVPVVWLVVSLAQAVNEDDYAVHEHGCDWESVPGTALPTGTLVFSSSCSGFTRLWLLRHGDQEPRQLAVGPSFDDEDPSASPDGRSIAFVSYQAGKDRIFTTGLEGGSSRLLWRSRKQEREPAWSPDGRRIAFFRWRSCPGTGPGYGTCRRGEIDVLRPGSSHATRIATVTSRSAHPTWSPDGTQIAFTARTKGSWREGLFVAKVDGGGVREIATTLHRVELQPAWSPDGRWIAFGCRSEKQGFDVCVIHPDGTGFRRLTHGLDSENPAPGWSPDSRWIAYVRSDPGVRFDEIWVMRANGQDAHVVAASSDWDGMEQDPSWFTAPVTSSATAP